MKTPADPKDAPGTLAPASAVRPSGGPGREPVRMESVLLDRSDPAFLADAYDTYVQLRAAGPVVSVRHCPVLRDEREQEGALKGQVTVRDLLFVGQYEAAAQALVDTRLASDPFRLMPPELRARMPPLPEPFRLFASSLIMRDAPDHSRLRKLVQPSFGPRAMEALAPRIQRIADQLLDAAEQQAEARGEHATERRMDLLRAFAHPLPVAVISDLLGIPEEDRESVRTWAAFRAESRNPAIIAETTQKFVAFSGYLRALFERKRQAPADDMISQMIHAQEDGDRLSEEELLSMIFLLYLAGHVTTVNLIGNGVVALLQHPDQLARFRADFSRAPAVVEEALRYWAPLEYLGTPRVASCPLSIDGVAVPAGAQVAVGLASANRDGARFPDPDRFDIDREDAHRHLAFGKGAHLCLGAPLARLEGQIAFETLFRRFPALRLAVPADTLRWTGETGTRGFREIPVLF